MDLVDAVMNLVNSIKSFGKGVLSFFSSLGSIISGLISIIQAIFYGLVSLLSKVWDLAVQIFDGGVFTNIGSSFNTLADYIGGPATVFLATMLFLIIIRGAIAFVFKIFRLNIDYHTKRSQTEKASIDDWRRSLKHLE